MDANLANYAQDTDNGDTTSPYDVFERATDMLWSPFDVLDSWVDGIGGALEAAAGIPGRVLDTIGGVASDASSAVKWGAAAYGLVAVTGTIGLYFLLRSGILTQIGIGIAKLVQVVL